MLFGKKDEDEDEEVQNIAELQYQRGTVVLLHKSNWNISYLMKKSAFYSDHKNQMDFSVH